LTGCDGDRHRPVARRISLRRPVGPEGSGGKYDEDLTVRATQLGRKDRLTYGDRGDRDPAHDVLGPREGGRGNDLGVHLDELEVRRRDLRLRRNLPSGDHDVRGRDRGGSLGFGCVGDEEGRRSGSDSEQQSNNQHQPGAASGSIFHYYLPLRPFCMRYGSAATVATAYNRTGLKPVLMRDNESSCGRQFRTRTPVLESGA